MLDKRGSIRYHFSINDTKSGEPHMKTMKCDICRKEIENPTPAKSWYVIREFDLCLPCKNQLDSRLQPIVLDHNPYSKQWYEQQVVGLIKKAISAGKI